MRKNGIIKGRKVPNLRLLMARRGKNVKCGDIKINMNNLRIRPTF
jgi:hypothetical protein